MYHFFILSVYKLTLTTEKVCNCWVVASILKSLWMSPPNAFYSWKTHYMGNYPKRVYQNTLYIGLTMVYIVNMWKISDAAHVSYKLHCVLWQLSVPRVNMYMLDVLLSPFTPSSAVAEPVCPETTLPSACFVWWSILLCESPNYRVLHQAKMTGSKALLTHQWKDLYVSRIAYKCISSRNLGPVDHPSILTNSGDHRRNWFQGSNDVISQNLQ